ncbi:MULTISPECIES: hypothetical protein [unclassified Bacillus (in: firmicutes)]|uniref:hypothetical protein n=1 Tax=unclassified Bacillus (in: firmicutes) TaxID=185979 RepID=UPI0008E5361C|nr:MULTISPECIES: hypothetical protein [unclassified Bacillus (in: firmicutes)]SFB25629.1 hypothetical protein SAMN02799634_1154 [Bacillus sp. UNCCL13]SFQ91786.1 hypothetical protein SAMN04488577_0168 [Bacillus sp. cl95]
MSKRGKGAPEKYTQKQLEETLILYATQKPGKITPSDLEKVTGIKRHVWSRRMKDQINRINKPFVYSNKDIEPLPLPNIEAIVKRYEGNSKLLIDALSHLNGVIHSLYEQNIRQQNKIVELEEKLQKEKQKIVDLNATINEYEQIIVGSSYGTSRRENGINKNLISIDKSNLENALCLDFKKMFPKIFQT